MGLFSKIFNKQITTEARNLLNQVFYSYMGAGQVQWFYGKRHKYVSAYTTNDLVYSVIRVILNKITATDYIHSRVINEKSFRYYKAFKDQDDLTRSKALIHKERAFDEIEDSDLIRLLNRPNEYQGRLEFMESLFGFYNLMGETFVYMVFPGEDSINAGKPVELHVMPAHLVEVVYSGDPTHPVRGYRFSAGRWDIELPYDSVIHINQWNPCWNEYGEQLRGFSPVQAGNRVITRNSANAEAQTRAFQNGGRSTLLSSKSAEKNAKLTVEQLSQIKEKIVNELQGVNNYKNITATNGLIEVNTIGDNLTDMDLVNAGKMDISAIARLWGVDPLLVGDKDNSSYNNQKQAYKALVTNVVVPQLNMITESLNNTLVPRFEEGSYLEFDTSLFPEMQPDVKLIMDAYKDAWQISGNELRVLLGFDKSDDPLLDQHFIGTNKIPLRQAAGMEDPDPAGTQATYTGNGQAVRT